MIQAIYLLTNHLMYMTAMNSIEIYQYFLRKPMRDIQIFFLNVYFQIYQKLVISCLKFLNPNFDL